MRATRIALALTVGVMLSACRASAPPLAGTEWQLIEMWGLPLLPGTAINLEFGEGQLGGFAGCNHYGGAYRTKGGMGLDVETLAITLEACLAPAGVLEQESTYIVALQAAENYEHSEGRLQLNGEKGGLLYRQRVVPEMDHAQLVGTTWQLSGMLGQPPTGTTPITLAFGANGEISGSAGCRGYTGRYQAEGDRIGFSFLAMTETECNASQEVALQESAFTEELSQAHNYRLSEGALEIDTVTGHTLVFEATAN